MLLGEPRCGGALWRTPHTSPDRWKGPQGPRRNSISSSSVIRPDPAVHVDLHLQSTEGSRDS